jgi:hypothetical protein
MKARIARHESTGSRKVGHPRLDDVMDIKFESGTAVDKIKMSSDMEATERQTEPKTDSSIS